MKVLLALLILCGSVLAQTPQEEDLRIDGKPVLQPNKALMASVNKEQKVLVELPAALPYPAFEAGKAVQLDLAYALQKVLYTEEPPPQTVTLTTVLVDGKPATMRYRTRVYYVLFSAYTDPSRHAPSFKSQAGEKREHFMVVADGRLISDREILDKPLFDNDILTRQVESSQKEGIDFVRFCTVILELDRVLVFRRDTKKVVYSYDFNKREKYEREPPQQ